MSSFHRFIMNITMVGALIAGSYVAQIYGAVTPAMADTGATAPVAATNG